ncbi:hypothetical protein [Duganella vulcania]|uniref:Uncharacterized protein n=1 Tax=Duganella vulcania TaxID=2692166 RepID=A0A845GVQ8_9BURK|nr:hypothetical protein [Duganella vulcania]MYM98374.1 hypothetical protein [Duganella vulcania]
MTTANTALSEKDSVGSKLEHSTAKIVTVAPTKITDTASTKEPSLKNYELTISPKPLQIVVDTPTDWPATVITPLVIAVVAAWFTWANQRFQVRSTTANFRHAWQAELRTTVTSYISAALEINMKCARDPDFLNKQEAEPLLTKITTTRATIRVMLDKEKSYTRELVDLMDEIADNIDDNGSIFDEKITEFTNKAQEVLELAWIDIRRDLQGKKKK